MAGSVRLVELGPRDGLMRGECGPYRWEANLARGPVSYGLDPKSLYKGAGRIKRLVLFAMIPGTGLTRKVAAFDRGWLFGRQQHIAVLTRLVGYLERC